MKKISLISIAKFQAILFCLLGFLAGGCYSFGGLIYDWWTTGLNWGTALAFFSLIGMPLIFGCFGLVVGFTQGILYNIFRKWIGPISLNP